MTHIESRIDGSRGIPGDWRVTRRVAAAYLTFAGGVEAVAACTTDNYAPAPKFHVKGKRGTTTVDDWAMNGKIVRRGEDLEPDAEPDAEPWVAGQGITKTMAPRIIDH